MDNVAAGCTGPGFMFDLGKASSARYANLPDICTGRIPGWAGDKMGRGARVLRNLARVPFGIFTGEWP